MFEAVIGQELAKKYFYNALRSRQLAHSYLFFGPPGVGKKTLAWQLLQGQVCREQELGFCGRCNACVIFQAGTHPDLFIMNGAEQPVTIAQARQLKQKMRFLPYGERHLGIIQEAEGLTTEAANSLLKILEDPPVPVLFVLTSSRPDSLPGTVLSRCLRIPFSPLSKAEIVRGLTMRRHDGPKAVAAAARAGGSLANAVEIIADKEIFKTREAVIKAVETLWQGERADEILQLAQKVGERSDRAALLKWTETLLLWYRDLLLWRKTESKEILINVDRWEQLQDQAARMTTSKLFSHIRVIEEIRFKLLHNVNMRLALEVLFLHLSGMVKEENNG